MELNLWHTISLELFLLLTDRLRQRFHGRTHLHATTEEVKLRASLHNPKIVLGGRSYKLGWVFLADTLHYRIQADKYIGHGIVKLDTHNDCK